MGPPDVDAATEDMIAAQKVNLPDYFTFAVRRRREVGPDQPEPTVSLHLTGEVGGEVFDEAIIDVGFGEAGGWQRETVTSHLLMIAGIEPVSIPVLPLEIQVAEKLHAYSQPYGPHKRASTRRSELLPIERWRRKSVLILIRCTATEQLPFVWTRHWTGEPWDAGIL